jgi:hypothetical protein
MTKKSGNRLIEENFFDDLLKGQLRNLLSIVHQDQTLDLQIRQNQVHIYYRGGKILDIKPQGPQDYIFKFDWNYFQDPNNKSIPVIKSILDLSSSDFLAFFPIAKQAMDTFLSKKKSEEREFQQLVVRTNNYSSLANSTDYFIVDIEYAHLSSRFDLIAIEWKSEATLRKLQGNYKPKLMIIEMKFGDGALGGKSGLNKHHQDILSFISNKILSQNFILEMENLFMQKIQLGLIPSLRHKKDLIKPIKFDDHIETGYLIADHDPASKRLINELISLKDEHAKFLTANFTGYGLYKENVFDLVTFKDRFNLKIS